MNNNTVIHTANNSMHTYTHLTVPLQQGETHVVVLVQNGVHTLAEFGRSRAKHEQSAPVGVGLS